MRDPKLIENVTEFNQYYRRSSEAPPGGWPSYGKERSPEQLLQDANVAHDNIKRLVRSHDALRGELGKLAKKLEVERMWSWGLTVMVFLVLVVLVAKL
jgi:hypothetical protein